MNLFPSDRHWLWLFNPSSKIIRELQISNRLNWFSNFLLLDQEIFFLLPNKLSLTLYSSSCINSIYKLLWMFFTMVIICNVYFKKITFESWQLPTAFKDKTLFIHFSVPSVSVADFEQVMLAGVLIKCDYFLKPLKNIKSNYNTHETITFDDKSPPWIAEKIKN